MKGISCNNPAEVAFKRADRKCYVSLKFNICKSLSCPAARCYKLDAEFSAGCPFHFIKKGFRR